MNAQQLLNETPVNNFNFGVFWKKTRESSQSPIKLQSEITRGVKSVDRSGNTKYHQVNRQGFITRGLQIPSFPADDSLNPQTFNYTKKQEALWLFKKEQALKDLEIPLL